MHLTSDGSEVDVYVAVLLFLVDSGGAGQAVVDGSTVSLEEVADVPVDPAAAVRGQEADAEVRDRRVEIGVAAAVRARVSSRRNLENNEKT